MQVKLHIREADQTRFSTYVIGYTDASRKYGPPPKACSNASRKLRAISEGTKKTDTHTPPHEFLYVVHILLINI